MLKIIACMLLTVLFTRCAQITPLTGGKKDTDAPRLLKAEPKQASLNFNAKTVVLEFNEFIVLKDLSNQLIITPAMNQLPDIEANGKTVIIKFAEPLQANTTYKMAFGNAITDLRENNPFQDFEYIFSTGERIDSLTLAGSVTKAFDNRPADNTLVSLYDAQAADSLIYREKPLYICKTDASGKFRFNYLPDRAFKLIAVKDVNKNLMYDGPDEMIAFYDAPVKPDSAIYDLKLFKETPAKTFIRKTYATEYGKAQIIYNKPYVDYTSADGKGIFAYSPNPTKDTLTIYYRDMFDTARVVVRYKDRKADTASIRIMSEESYKKLVQKKSLKYFIATNVSSGSLEYYRFPQISINYPALSGKIDPDRIKLTEWKDSMLNQVAVHLTNPQNDLLNFSLESKLSPATAYTLTLEKGLFTDNAGRTSDSTSYNFKTTSPEDYAQLSLKLMFPKKENYIVQLLNDKDQVIRMEFKSFALTETAEQKFDFQNLKPGNYFIKVIEDANNNGRFDDGDFISHKQPERIYYNANPIKLLADWEIENEWKVQ
ncbi:MAG: Ig-like domain-containing protein [Bacteroidetes bacterium]|nr:Ig-like domain-containing protein [Bacteroidota bacterium]